MNVAMADNSYRDDIDLRGLIAEIRRRRWWVVASAALFTTAALVVALVSTPIYRASTMLVPAAKERSGLSGQLGSALGSLGGLAAMAGLSLDGNEASTQEALAVLRSRQFTEAFIQARGLMPKLFASKWDEAAQQWKVPEKRRPTPAKAYKYFDRKIRAVDLDKKTGLVTLRIDWRDRNEAAAWANELVQRLNAEMRQRAIDNATASLRYLEKELADTSAVETRAAINRLAESQIKQRMLANVTEQYAFRVVDRAIAPDADDRIWPRRALLVAAGLSFGLVFAILCIFALMAVRGPDGSGAERPR